MASLRDIVKAIHGAVEDAGDGEVLEPYYKPEHLKWLRRTDRAWSQEALQLARDVLDGKRSYERSLRISPSALGGPCEREMLFSYGGAPQVTGPIVNEDLMESGAFEHLRWQMEGLSQPFLSHAEIYLHVPELRCGGSLDGVGVDGSLFELKNTASHLYEPISRGPAYLAAALKREDEGQGSAAAYAAHMVRKHHVQMEVYWLLDSLQPVPLLSEYGSLLYQDRASKEVHEIRVRTDAGRRREVHAILEGLHDWIDLDQLPDMLAGCQAVLTPGETATTKQVTVFNRCSFREHCPTADTVLLPKPG